MKIIEMTKCTDVLYDQSVRMVTPKIHMYFIRKRMMNLRSFYLVKTPELM